MRARCTVTRYAAGAVMLAMLAGCSGAGATLGSPGSQEAGSSAAGVNVAAVARQMPGACAVHAASKLNRFWNPNVRMTATRTVHGFVSSALTSNTTNVIAVADAENDVVDAFDAHGTPLAEITGLGEPTGLASDIRGDLFVADLVNQRIAVYAAGLRTKPIFLQEPGWNPVGVDSFNNGKIVASANFGYGCGAGGVNFFVDGVLKKTITSQLLAGAWFCAFDAVGNLYVDGVDGDDNPVVGEIEGGVHGKAFTSLATTNQITSPVGIQVTTHGRIAILDQAGTLYTYNPPSKGSLGGPISATSLQTPDPVGFAFTKYLASTFVTDIAALTVERYDYPSGGSPVSSSAISGEPIGVTVIPAEYPER